MSAATQITSDLSNLISHEDLLKMLEIQEQIKTNMHQSVETLTTFNEYSSNTYNTLNKDFEKHTKMLKEMKKDLNVIFKRIRALRSRLHEKFPEATGYDITADPEQDE